MAENFDPELLPFLACPDCGGHLVLQAQELVCPDQGISFPVTDGLPLLYPAKMDLQHLREEEKLAGFMQRSRTEAKEQFSLRQWENSKQEFWRSVSRTIGAGPQTILNIGCGYDLSFIDFQNRGHRFINFDLVASPLKELSQKQGARFCVAGDLFALPFQKGVFDALVCIDVIHHLARRLPEILLSFKQLLKPGGRLFLSDPNAWALYQLPKTILLPRPVHRQARRAYHRLRRSSHRPADYEFPTRSGLIKAELIELGFAEFKLHENLAYPTIGPGRYALWRVLAVSRWVRRRLNFHWRLSAVRK